MINRKEKRDCRGLTEAEFLAQYNPRNYEKPSVTVDMLVLRMNHEFNQLQLLLIQRRNHPYIDCWALPGGFVDIKESAYQAACRELEEETGLKNIYLEQLYTMTQPERDPRMRVIDIAYMALLPASDTQEAVAGDDAKAAMWFDLSFNDKVLTLENKEANLTISYKLNINSFNNGAIKVDSFVPQLVTEEALAFDHQEILLEGLTRLRNKAEYSDILFNLVPEEFTLADLQKVHEIALGRELFRKNFNAKVADRIIPLEKKGPSLSSGKKAALYKYYR